MESSKHKKLVDEVKSGHVGDPKRIPLVLRLIKLPTVDAIREKPVAPPTQLVYDDAVLVAMAM